MLAILTGSVSMPLELLVGMNVGFALGMAESGYDVFVFAGFVGMAAGSGLILAARFVPVWGLVGLSRFGMSASRTWHGVVDSLIPNLMYVAFGVVFTVLAELMIFPVAVVLLFGVAQAKHSGETFDERHVTPLDVTENPTKKQKQSKASKASHPVLIVLIHGNKFNECQWLFGRICMMAQPWSRHVSFMTVNMFTGAMMREHTNETETVKGCSRVALYQILDQIKDRNLQPRKIVLMGHSLGGIVSAYINEYFAVEYNLPIAKVISWSSPFYGSDLISFGRKILPGFVTFHERGILRDLTPLAETSKQLVKRMERTEKKKSGTYFAITGQIDPLARPHSTLPAFYLKNNRVLIPYLGHYQIKVSLNAWTHIVLFIGEFVEQEAAAHDNRKRGL